MDRRTALSLIPAATLGIRATHQAAAGQSQPSLCSRYLAEVRQMLHSIRHREMDHLLEAAYRTADTVKRGGTCFNQWDMGHNIEFDLFPDRHGDPGFFVNGYDAGRVRSGDLVLLSIVPNWEPMKPPPDGVFVIGAPAPWSAETRNPELLTPRNRALTYRHFSDLWIDTGISTHGAVMWLPGSPVPMGPTSGVLGLMTFWIIIADAVRLLAREGHPITVHGDEPPLGDNAPYVSLDVPLGRQYFEEAYRQLTTIEMERGTIETVAGRAVDTILSGGHVYHYSRYRNSLSYESVYRRGGLLLNRSVMAGNDGPVGGAHFPEFEGAAGDMVIMGISQPDHPTAKRDYTAFRKRGMQVVTIGPRTRGGRIPGSETLPEQADYHLGNMCDTYGLFAVPGVLRRICPTSGLLMNQLFYALEMQIADDIMARTGNTPRIDANAAMIGGLEKRRRDLEIVRVRGY